jgi:hypothetical protein
MKSASRRYLQSLLDRRQEMIQLIGPDRTAAEYCLTYGELCHRAGFPSTYARCCRWHLFEVAEFCAAQGWPPINSWAVSARTLVPGGGYEGAGECTFQTWEDDVLACVHFAGYPTVVPPDA